MKKYAYAAAIAVGSATVAQAGGLDRSGQSVGFLFDEGNVVELSFGAVFPSVSGNDVAVPFGGRATGDVANSYIMPSFSIKHDLSEQLSLGFIVDNAFGADVLYPAGQSVALANATSGTKGYASVYAATALARYKFSDRFSVHGGLRYQTLNGEIDLRGLAYGGLGNYSARIGSNDAFGYVIGGAFEIPTIAARVALTYNSAVTHTAPMRESLAGPAALAATGNTQITTPQSVNLEFQTGIMENTLLTGGVRWANWSQVRLNPNTFSGATGGNSSLISIEDTYTYTLGVGRRFSEQFAGSVSFTYEAGGNPLVSPLGPTNGRFGVTVGGSYTMDNMTLSGGVNYTWLGDASAATGTPSTARANFTGNTSLGIGMSLAYRY